MIISAQQDARRARLARQAGLVRKIRHETLVRSSENLELRSILLPASPARLASLARRAAPLALTDRVC